MKSYEIKPFLLIYSSFSIVEEQDYAIKKPNVTQRNDACWNTNGLQKGKTYNSIYHFESLEQDM